MDDDSRTCLEFLQASFPLEGELELSEEAQAFLEDAPSCTSGTRRSLEACISLSLDGQTEPLRVDLSIPGTGNPELEKVPRMNVRQPTFLTRTQHAALTDSLSPVTALDDIYAVLEEIKPAAELLLVQAQTQQKQQQDELDKGASAQFTGKLVRSWFWFSTVSTPEKRDDITQWAPRYGLTGFLLAGKPGVLCLEGQTDAIDAFWKEIKTFSWAEIPSFQKKVSERHRELLDDGDTARKFSNMSEIDVARRGQKGNRGDMGQLHDWMKEHGVGDAFDKVIL